jgi:hypothetical protein
MQTTTTQTTRRFLPSAADQAWAARVHDLAADRRIAACRTAKIQRSRGPSAEDLDFAAAMFAADEMERQERRAADQAAFRREQRMDVSRWHDHPSPTTPAPATQRADANGLLPLGECIRCSEMDFVDSRGLCPCCENICLVCGVRVADGTDEHGLCPKHSLEAMEQSTPNQQRSFPGAL